MVPGAFSGARMSGGGIISHSLSFMGNLNVEVIMFGFFRKREEVFHKLKIMLKNSNL